MVGEPRASPSDDPPKEAGSPTSCCLAAAKPYKNLPVYRMEPKVKLFFQAVYNDPVFSRNTIVVGYSKELLRMFISAKAARGGVCTFQQNGF
jgi:hypothetical protein